MCKATEMEDFPSRRGGDFAYNRTTPLDVKSGQMFWWNRKFPAKKLPPCDAAFDAILNEFGRCFRADPSAERWQSGRMRRFAKPLYGLKPVPGVRIPPSPPDPL